MLCTLVGLVALSGLSQAAPKRWSKGVNLAKRLTWTAAETYEGSSFFDGWTFETGADSGTQGMVNYVQDSSLAYVDSTGAAIIKVDNSTDLAANQPRNSVRIHSNAVLNESGLVIADFSHVPFGCSIWPAFWLLGSGSWPSGGEVDIFEGVNANTQNSMTLHTSAGCTHDTTQPETGTALSPTDCDGLANGNAGCGVQDPSTASFGDGFNNAGGGVWATQWDSDGISIWFFTRSAVPGDIGSGSPDPTSWGTPTGFWSFDTGACSSSFFTNLMAVFDITLCGSWAGASNIYAQTCSGTCSDQVMSAANYDDAYFAVNSVKFFTGS